MKVLVYYSQLNIGGAERSNVRLMRKMIDAGWEVTLILRYGKGTLEHEIPKEAEVIYLRKNNSFLADMASSSLTHKARGYVKVVPELINEQKAKNALRKRQYDIAIIGLQGLDAQFVKDNVKANKYLLWIRNDLRSCDPTGRVVANIRKNQSWVDYYPCVSQTSFDSFVEALPDLKEKAVLFYNIIDEQTMLESAKQPSCIDGKYCDALKVLSVCRIADKAKGVFRMLDIYEKLRKEGVFFYWLVAGNGPDYEELKRRTEQKGLQDGFVLLGHQANPFPLYRQCDIVAVLSYYEGLCGIVNEAKVLGKPVIATEFSGIHEQIVSEDGGIIVNNTFEDAYAGLKRLLLDKDLRQQLANRHLSKDVLDDNYKLRLLEQMIGKE